ncbi:MAG: amino acid ABC transporter ATP-binding protein [Treponema sp.]|jgi:polar amino acid transport system ATP-binding protein|nr:amino acid ABC transporter ATP-binding protein [Treponema sp.]
MIEIAGLCKRFNDNIVLDELNLRIEKSQVVAIIGPSGTGKSTLLRCINLLEQPEKGRIRIGDFSMDLTEHSSRNRVELRKRTAMVFQQFNLFQHKTTLENVMEGLIIVKKMNRADAETLARRYLAEVGLSDRLGHYPQHLSGGQQQRVAIARALAMSPDVLLFDEPTSALDPELAGEVLDTIREAARSGYTMILVSHEMNFVRTVASRVLFLENGKIIEDGIPAEVFNHPKNPRTKEFLAKMNQLNGPEYAI